LALSSGELSARFCHGGCHTLPPALGETTAQDSDQFGLRVRIQLFGGGKGVGKCVWLTHRNLSIGIISHCRRLGDWDHLSQVSVAA
jgi:hypothetical protein